MSDPSTAATGRGGVAAGHPKTAAAAVELLEDGGNAFDAVLAAMCMACVAEPVLASLGGGGFLLARGADGGLCVHDFFVDTPRKRRPADECDFYPVVADFGTATQDFHIGLGSIAVPGAVRGLFDIHRERGSVPISRVVEPAIRAAREGVEVGALQAFIIKVVGPIMRASAAAERLVVRADGRFVEEGDLISNPDLADALDALAREGDGLFYEGEMGRSMVRACAEGGGHLTANDLSGYTTARRPPLRQRYRGVEVWSNPPPSLGGALIAFGLGLLDGEPLADHEWGSPGHTGALARVMALTSRARVDSGDVSGLLEPSLLARYLEESARLRTSRGTTHVSVADAAGNLAALTLSNGEGCGYVLPGTGMMLNNVLGEEDVNPHGFHRWPEGKRVSSMMAPTIVARPDGSALVLGSGGSKRIRTAVLQAIVNFVDFGLAPRACVDRSRLHTDGAILDVEAGFEDDAIDAALASCRRLRSWPDHNLYFGGVHLVVRDANGHVDGAGDPRRGGVYMPQGLPPTIAVQSE